MRRIRFVYIFLFISVITFSHCCEENVEIEIPQGRLSGKVNFAITDIVYNSFRGIPYAEPPVGELRFKPSKPHRGWESTYEAHANKPTCLQFNTRMRNGEKYGISGSEDCLYLNVHTSTTHGSYPVVVFDYNDNFKTGFNATTYLPDYFIAEKVVVVTVNHRLGALGYLTTEDNVIPANNGIKDFILALKWIQDNIKYFSGDPNNVTLMGSRGGAALINLLQYTEQAKGLFHKVILQSGTAMEPIIISKNAKQNAFDLGNLFNIDTNESKTLLEELQKVDIEDLLTNEGKISNDDFEKTHQLTMLPFMPVVENKSPESIITSLPEKAKIVNDVPVLIGFNSRDGLDLASPFIYEPRFAKDITYDNFFIHFPIRSNFRFDRNATDFHKVIQEIWDFYFTIGYFDPNNVYEYAVYLGDVLQNYAINYAAKKMAREIESPVYYYLFDFRGVLNENSEFMTRKARSTMKHWGATIGDELCYLLLCNRIRSTYKELEELYSVQLETKTLRKMVRLWTNFIATGNPTPDEQDEILQNTKWTPIKKDSKDVSYLHITKKLSMKSNPLEKREMFWNEFLQKYSMMAEGDVVRNIIPILRLNDEL